MSCISERGDEIQRDVRCCYNARAQSSNPSNISDDQKNADGHHGGQGAGHAHLDQNSNDGQTTHHAGGLMLLAIRTSASDFSGSGAIFVSMKAHFEHSKVRFSVPSGRGTIRVRSMRVRHRAQRGRSIGDSRTSVKDIFMAHPLWENFRLRK